MISLAPVCHCEPFHILILASASVPIFTFSLDRHLHHKMTVRYLIALKWRVRHPDNCIYILYFSMLNFSFLIHMPRIASTIKILFQIC